MTPRGENWLAEFLGVGKSITNFLGVFLIYGFVMMVLSLFLSVHFLWVGAALLGIGAAVVGPTLMTWQALRNAGYSISYSLLQASMSYRDTSPMCPTPLFPRDELGVVPFEELIVHWGGEPVKMRLGDMESQRQWTAFARGMLRTGQDSDAANEAEWTDEELMDLALLFVADTCWTRRFGEAYGDPDTPFGRVHVRRREEKQAAQPITFTLDK